MAKSRSEQELREVFHFLFLERLQKLSDPKLYILKGGVNLRFFFNSPRYSEDMDLDVLKGSVDTLKKNGYKILEDASFQRSLQTFGVEDLIINDKTKAKQTETTQRFRAQLVNSAGESLPTKIEFSRRKQPVATEYEIATIAPTIATKYFRLSFSCQHYTAPHAIVQKIHALYGRSETQARDVIDLYILYLGGKFEKKTIQSITAPEERLKAIMALDTIDYEAFQGQALDYLEPDFKESHSTKFEWEQMKNKVRELLHD